MCMSLLQIGKLYSDLCFNFLEKGDFCWHCHTGIFAYPMQVALKEEVPLLFWGEPSAEYTAYYSYDEPEEVDETRFNRFINLGISSDDMSIRLGGVLDERDLAPFKYPELVQLKKLGYRSVCLGSYIPWDVKMQVQRIKEDLGWEGDYVENVPEEYNYEKIECWMQGVRDYIKYIKRGYSRPSHLAAIDLRNNRISQEEAETMIRQYEGRRPPSLDLFLEYTGLTEHQFYLIAKEHEVTPWSYDSSDIIDGKATPDFGDWIRGVGLDPAEAGQQLSNWSPTCSNCNDVSGCSKD